MTCEGKCLFQHDVIAVDNFILNNILLSPMMLGVDHLLSQLYYLFMIIIVLWLLLLSLSQMFLSSFLSVIMFQDVIEPCVDQGGHQALMLWGCYLSLGSGDLTNTSSYICGSWYLPIFLFRDGSLTLISIASLMGLAILWSSLPTMLKFSRERSWPVVLWCHGWVSGLSCVL